MLRNIWIIVVILAVTACTSSTVGRKIDSDVAAKIQKGVSTKSDVIALIGSPDRIMNMGTGDSMWTYSYSRMSMKPQSFIPIVNMFNSGTNTQQQHFMITFDMNNIVTDIMNSQSATEISSGIGK
jgi:outer membrane protein assembly factor BamE (lipoprotein component of BamABCDE complex)